MEATKSENQDRIEVYAGSNKLILIKKNLLEFIADGGYEIEDALLVKEVLFKLITKADEDYVMLADISKVGKSSSEARQVWKELNESCKNRKIALIGMGVAARVLSAFALAFTVSKNVKLFTTRQEALKWLGRINGNY